MPNSGDVVDLDLGAPEGREAGFRHPAVVITAQRVLDASPTVVQVVPLTSTLGGFPGSGSCVHRTAGSVNPPAWSRRLARQPTGQCGGGPGGHTRT